MTEDALAVFDEANVPLYGMFSGGHDSLAATALAAKHRNFRGVVHINTGIGVEETHQFVRDTCRQHGWTLHELKPPAGKYEELVLTRGGFPYGPMSHNVMLFYLKQLPLRRWLDNIEGQVGLVTGIRLEESVRRMGAGISVPIRKERRKTWISPILGWTKIDCNLLIAQDGMQRNQVVDLLHRSAECLCGAMAKVEEIHEIARWYPDAAQRIQQLERECERRGIVASVWAGYQARNLQDGQMQLFSKAELPPLCTSCEANA